MLGKMLSAAVVLGLLVSSASAEVIVNERTPVVIDLFNSCTGEFVQINGEVHTQFTPANQEHGAHFRMNATGTGVGEVTGIEYVFSQTFHQQIKNAPSGAFEFTGEDTIRLISKGSAENEFMLVRFGFAVDADGNFESFFTAEEICR